MSIAIYKSSPGDSISLIKLVPHSGDSAACIYAIQAAWRADKVGEEDLIFAIDLSTARVVHTWTIGRRRVRRSAELFQDDGPCIHLLEED